MSDSWVLSGHKATGKTTFLSTGGAAVPDTFEELVKRAKAGETFDCSDVVLFQLETDGDLGARDLGLKPCVVDLTRRYVGWPDLNAVLVEEVKKLLAEIKAGRVVRVVGIDLGPVDTEIVRFAAGDRASMDNLVVNPKLDTSANEVNWNLVDAQGGNVFRILRILPATVVAMTHLKVANAGARTNKQSSEDRERQEMERDMRAFGGDAQKTTPDISKGVYKHWHKNASHIVVCDVDKVNVGTALSPKYETRYSLVTESNGTYEAGTRARSVLQPREKRTLNGLLKAIETKRSAT